MNTLYQVTAPRLCAGFHVRHDGDPMRATVSADSAPILIRGRQAPLRVGMGWREALTVLRRRGWGVQRMRAA